jgi:hypothetical protein
MGHPQYKRRKKLIDPRLQLRMTGAFLAMAALSLLLQFLLFAQNLSSVAATLPQDGPVLMERTGGLLGRTLLVSFGLLLPVTLLVGVMVTFRVAGPMYRFRAWLGEIADGGDPGVCRIRKGDEFQDFCKLLNRVAGPLREANEAAKPEDSRSGEEVEAA